jgi:hypothetical protein
MCKSILQQGHDDLVHALQSRYRTVPDMRADAMALHSSLKLRAIIYMRA